MADDAEMEDLKIALSCFEKSVKENPNSIISWLLKASTHSLLGQTKEVYQCIRRIVELVEVELEEDIAERKKILEAYRKLDTKLPECSVCGNPVIPEDTFCPHCGAKLR